MQQKWTVKNKKFYVSKIGVTEKRFTDATLYLEKKKQQTIISAFMLLCKKGIIDVSFKRMCIN